MPDNLVATLIFEYVENKFTYKDGTIRTLTGGRGSMSVRQWHAYPNILPHDLYSNEVYQTVCLSGQTVWYINIKGHLLVLEMT